MPGAIQRIEFSAAVGAWQLHRAEPPDALRGLVVEYWEVEGALTPFRETLLPNGCVEVMINLGPPHRVLSSPGTGEWTRGWFSGLHEHALVIESLEGTHLLSARLHPLGAAALFGSRAPAAANDIVDLDVFLEADGERLRASALHASSPGERFALLEDFLLERLRTSHLVPELVREAARQIEVAHGAIRIAALHEALGISRKHLAVSFQRYAGVSPKNYARIRRFLWTLERLRESESVSWSVLAHDAGYSDQSHLARDFKQIGAASPTEYLRRRAPDGSALLYEANE